MTTTDASGGAPEPTEEEIISALRAAGWLLEQETETCLERQGFHTSLNAAFPDPDDLGKSREVDVMAYRELYRNDEIRLSIGIRCLAECKQSSMPYVLIGKPPSAYERERTKLEQLLRFDSVVTSKVKESDRVTRWKSEDAREFIGLNRIPEAPWKRDFVATQMTRLERKATWLADNRGIFDGLVYPLAKATQYFRKNYRPNRVFHDRATDWATVQFLYPMVVTSSPIYRVDASSEYAIDKAKWVPMIRQLKSGSLNGTYVIDVVTYSALEEYLEKYVLAFGAAVQEIAESDPELFVTSGHEPT
ncbi:hypothetical protein [Nocardia goodfellowii]|uniref:Uncharacterized protein n=1 Tax=Nocardia goodfellowii TaxID=882446 RepID=A0ABS4QRD5_9NOCA|nr:hypothetical protein [Nocardia goodfellowii]MBP2193614.1 hypothetical protein [Nocardia goodfellowii]